MAGMIENAITAESMEFSFSMFFMQVRQIKTYLATRNKRDAEK